MQRIADEAGVARSTFYVHFADKTALLLRFAETTSASIFATADAWAAAATPTLDGLRRTLAAILADYRAHAPAYAALAEVAAYDPEVAAYWSARVEGFSAVVRERIDAQRGDAGGDGPLHTRTATRWMAWGLERVIGLQSQQEPAGDAAFVDELAAALWATLR